MDVDPYWLHAYWEITLKDKTKISAQSDKASHSQKRILRVYDVSFIHFDGNNAHSYFDIEIDKDKGNWYINLWNPRKSFCAEIGMRSLQGDFHPIARSNVIDSPRPHRSSSGGEQWMKVTGTYEEVSLLPAKPRLEKIEPKETLLKRGRGLLAPDLKREHIPSPEEKISSKSLTSIKKELLQETPIKQPSPPTISQSYKEKKPFKKKIIKNALKGYYGGEQIIGRHQEEKIQTPSPTNPKDKAGSLPEKDITQRLFNEKHTRYGSDIRWEEEITKPDDRGREKIITPEMIKKNRLPR